MKIEIELPDVCVGYFQQLLHTGLYGFDENEVATRLLERQLRQEVKNRNLIPEERGQLPKCPHCGSPKIFESQTMGSDLECEDCNQTFMSHEALV